MTSSINWRDYAQTQTEKFYKATLWQGEHTSEEVSRIELYYNSSNATTVNWSFEQQLKWYPWEKLGSMMNDKILGTMMERNLNNLRALAAHAPR